MLVLTRDGVPVYHWGEARPEMATNRIEQLAYKGSIECEALQQTNLKHDTIVFALKQQYAMTFRDKEAPNVIWKVHYAEPLCP
jgi:hypothetical protein